MSTGAPFVRVLDRVRLAGGPSSASTGAEPEGPAPGVVRGRAQPLSMSTQQTHAMYGGESSADLTRVVIVDFEF